MDILPPERIIERMADIEHRAYFDGRRMTPIIVPLDGRRQRILFMWHDMHYSGRPDRENERMLAFARFVAARADDDPEVERVMHSEAQRLARA